MKTVFCLLWMQLLARGQQVAGKVVNSVTGDPVKKATVILRAQGGSGQRGSYAVETDSHGQFAIAEVEPGAYLISVDRPGFHFQARGATGAPPPLTTIEQGKDVKDLVVSLIPTGVIAGRVLDEDGDPVRGAEVQAMRAAYSGGKKEMTSVAQVTSNDIGEYRLYGLTPGAFYIQASPNDGESNDIHAGETIRGPRRRETPAPTYFPSANDPARAVPIEVAPGAQLRGLDVRLRRQRLWSVRVKLPSEPDEKHTYSGKVSSLTTRYVSARQFSDGDMFTFQGLAPGSYILTIIQAEGEKHSYARLPVDVVDADLDAAVPAFAPAVEVAGVVRADDQKLHPWENIRISLMSDAWDSDGDPNATVGADGSFEIQNIAPDIYRLTTRFIQPVPDAYVKSAQVGDHDLVDWQLDLTKPAGPLTILLGTDVGQIEGSVRNANGEPVVRARVNLIPYGDHSGRTDQTRFAFSDEKGEFKFKSVAPAQYRIFAWEDVEVGRPQDPAFRKRFEKQSALVKMGPNGHEKIQVTAVTAEAAKKPDLQ
jgi:protocatechuate 3,4-dioxygenase beta subunit